MKIYIDIIKPIIPSNLFGIVINNINQKNLLLFENKLELLIDFLK